MKIKQMRTLPVAHSSLVQGTSCFVLAAQQARFEGRVRPVGVNIDLVKSERTSIRTSVARARLWIDESDPHRFQYVNGCCQGL